MMLAVIYLYISPVDWMQTNVSVKVYTILNQIIQVIAVLEESIWCL